MKNHTPYPMCLSSDEISGLVSGCDQIARGGPECYRKRFMDLKEKVLLHASLQLKAIDESTSICVFLSSAEVSDLATACHRMGCTGPECYREQFMELRNKVLDQALGRDGTSRAAA